MSLHQAAKYIASKGRGEDTVLIHMTPKEVGSLQALAMAHGGSLTTNPDTGLPEAGFLSSILPMVAGAALTGLTGGVINPMTAGMIIGGIEGARTGDLGKGLVAGLGAYGGGGIGAGLMGAGAASAQNAAIQAAPQTAEFAGALADPYAMTGTQGALNQAAADATTRAVVNPFQATDAMSAMGTNAQTMGSGLSSLAESKGRDAFMASMGGGKGALVSGLAAATPMMMVGDETPPPVQGSGPNPYKYTYETGVASPFPQADARGVEQNYFPNAGYVRQPTSALPLAGGGLSDAFTPGQPVMYAAKGGGMYDLGDYSDGGRLLRGPGDGVSDSIPATIGDKRPARLADGEFVVPARIVSELGNGSTEAGARKLYAMMDRVQKARGKTVGKDRVAKNTRADKYLPA